jgi:hypothetical protein
LLFEGIPQAVKTCGRIDDKQSEQTLKMGYILKNLAKKLSLSVSSAAENPADSTAGGSCSGT